MKLSETHYVGGLTSFLEVAELILLHVTHLDLANADLTNINEDFFTRLALCAKLHAINLERASISPRRLQRMLAILHQLPAFKILIHRDLIYDVAAVDISAAKFILIPSPKGTFRTPTVAEAELDVPFNYGLRSTTGWNIRQRYTVKETAPLHDEDAPAKFWTKTDIQFMLLRALDMSRRYPNIINFSYKRVDISWSVKVIGGRVHLVPDCDIMPGNIYAYNAHKSTEQTKHGYMKNNPLKTVKLAITFAGNNSLEPQCRLVKKRVDPKKDYVTHAEYEVLNNNLFGNDTYMSDNISKNYLSLTITPGIELNDFLYKDEKTPVLLSVGARIQVGFAVMLLFFRELGMGQLHNDVKPGNILVKKIPGSNVVMAQFVDFATMVEKDTSFTVHKKVTHTGGYAAPEVLDLVNSRANATSTFTKAAETYAFAKTLQIVFDNSIFDYVENNKKHFLESAVSATALGKKLDAQRASKIKATFGPEFHAAFARLLITEPEDRGSLHDFMMFVIEKYPALCRGVLLATLGAMLNDVELLLEDQRFINSRSVAAINPWLANLKANLNLQMSINTGLDYMLSLDLIKSGLHLIVRCSVSGASIVVAQVQQALTMATNTQPITSEIFEPLHKRFKRFHAISLSLRRRLLEKIVAMRDDLLREELLRPNSPLTKELGVLQNQARAWHMQGINLIVIATEVSRILSAHLQKSVADSPIGKTLQTYISELNQRIEMLHAEDNIPALTDTQSIVPYIQVAAISPIGWLYSKKDLRGAIQTQQVVNDYLNSASLTATDLSLLRTIKEKP